MSDLEKEIERLKEKYMTAHDEGSRWAFEKALNLLKGIRDINPEIKGILEAKIRELM